MAVRGKHVSDYPTLVAEWHPTKNLPLTPDVVTAGSQKRIHWRCAVGHEFVASSNARTNTRHGGIHECGECARLTRWTWERVLAEARAMRASGHEVTHANAVALGRTAFAAAVYGTGHTFTELRATLGIVNSPPRPRNPCAKCGDMKRYASGDCPTCAIRRAKAAYASNPEPIRARSKAVRLADPEARSAIDRAYYQEHREEIKARMRRYVHPDPAHARALLRKNSRLWRAANRERYLAVARSVSARRHARGRGAGGRGVNANEWARMCEEHGYRCVYCDLEMARSTSVETWRSAPTRDHVVPVARGGPDEIANVVPACFLCNSRKQTSQWPMLPHHELIFVARVRRASESSCVSIAT